MTLCSLILGPIFEPTNETCELLNRFFVRLPTFFDTSFFRIAQHTTLAVATGPGNDSRWTGSRKRSTQ